MQGRSPEEESVEGPPRDVMRARIAWESTPIIMLTAKAQEQDVAKALRAGANDYLLKPFHPADLLARVHKLCARETPAS